MPEQLFLSGCIRTILLQLLHQQ